MYFFQLALTKRHRWYVPSYQGSNKLATSNRIVMMEDHTRHAAVAWMHGCLHNVFHHRIAANVTLPIILAWLCSVRFSVDEQLSRDMNYYSALNPAAALRAALAGAKAFTEDCCGQHCGVRCANGLNV